VTLEVVVIGFYRVVGSLPTWKWPLAGGLLAIFVDLTDLYLMNVLDLGGIPDYQLFDKLADQVYLAVFLLVALRWTGPERAISIVLYAFRMVGFVLFELTGDRAVLLLFPNVFEFWFLFIAAFHHVRPAMSWTRAELALVLVPLIRQGGPGMGSPLGAPLRQHHLPRRARADPPLAPRPHRRVVAGAGSFGVSRGDEATPARATPRREARKEGWCDAGPRGRMSGIRRTSMPLSLPTFPVKLSPEEERRARAYIWAIVARADLPTEDLEAEAVRLWARFGETYVALTTGAYAKSGKEAFRIALGQI
jgi:hypothetical protein